MNDTLKIGIMLVAGLAGKAAINYAINEGIEKVTTNFVKGKIEAWYDAHDMASPWDGEVVADVECEYVA